MRSVAVALAALALASVGRAQTLYTFDPALAVTEISGPPAPPCLYPNGPVNFVFPAAPGACAGPGPIVAPLGDVAVNPLTDVVYVSDGAAIFAYAAGGAPLGFGVPPIVITGMGVGVGGMLWITDGFVYGAVALAGIGCPAGPLPFVVGPFPVPIGPIFGGPIGDIDFDPATGSLIGCDAAGVVGSFLPGPAPAPGPYGAFAAPACLAPPLVGIAFDKAFAGTGTVFVTDGAIIARILPGGALAPATFYFPLNCIPIPGALPKVGLAFAGRQITYGAGADNSGLPAPTIGSIGQSYVGNPAFGVTLAGSVPGGTAFLRYSFGAACPPLPAVGVPFYLAAPRFPAATLPVGAGGGAGLAVPIPPATPPGITVYLQWIVLTGVSVQSTSGAALTTILP
jgi:hypothetical protein